MRPSENSDAERLGIRDALWFSGPPLELYGDKESANGQRFEAIISKWNPFICNATKTQEEIDSFVENSSVQLITLNKNFHGGSPDNPIQEYLDYSHHIYLNTGKEKGLG